MIHFKHDIGKVAYYKNIKFHSQICLFGPLKATMKVWPESPWRKSTKYKEKMVLIAHDW